MDSLFDFPSCEIQKTDEENVFSINIPQVYLEDAIRRLASFGKIENIPRPRKSGHLFPWSPQVASSLDNFGPVIIPSEGLTINLSSDSFPWYRSIIDLEMGNAIMDNDILIINNIPTKNYTIKKNYVFLLGDNRHLSQDSRTFGFIPVEDVKAIATRILFSFAENENSYKKRIILKRSLKKIE